MPTWIIHGQRDNVVRPSAVSGLVDRLQSGDGKAWFTLLPQTGHDAWRVVYGSEKVQQWLQNPTSEGTVPRRMVDRVGAVILENMVRLGIFFTERIFPNAIMFKELLDLHQRTALTEGRRATCTSNGDLYLIPGQ